MLSREVHLIGPVFILQQDELKYKHNYLFLQPSVALIAMFFRALVVIEFFFLKYK